MRSICVRVAALSALGLSLAVAASAVPKAGTAAPAFSGKTIAGKAINLGQYRGKAVLLNFFSRY